MADLDSFFAKKDKKKVKGKKFTTPDEIARRLEEKEKKLEIQASKEKVETLQKKLEENPNIETIVVSAPPKKEEEEWNDFKDEAEKDLTDLKIAQLKIESEEEGEGEDSEDGEGGEGRSKKDGVWKKQEAPQADPSAAVSVNMDAKPEQQAAALQAAAAASAARAAEAAGGGGGGGKSSYVPPHMRNSMASERAPMPKRSSRASKVAPDISNEMAFPSLADTVTANPQGAWGKKKMPVENNIGFENVKGGSVARSTEDNRPQKLSTANRFNALSDNMS